MPDRALTLPSYYANGMVLQQQTPNRIIGLATPRVSIELTLERHPAPQQTVSSLDRRFGTIYRDTTEADRNGHFSFLLPELQASYCRYTLTLSTIGSRTGDEASPAPYVRRPGLPRPIEDLIVIDDILIGEVWVSGGQDNMALPLAFADQGQFRQLLDQNDFVRFLLHGEEGREDETDYAIKPRERLTAARWTRAGNVLDLRRISAIAAHFAQTLHQSLDVPVGIISTEVSGTLIASWISYETLAATPEAVSHLTRIRLWRTAEGLMAAGEGARFQPGVYFNARIAPLRALACRGILWYQGESDVAFPDYYQTVLPRMLEDWQRVLQPVAGQTLAFVYCQLAPYCYPTLPPETLPRFNAMLARIRAELPLEAGLVALHDQPLDYDKLPPAWSHPLHPQAKAAIGHRCARIALGLAYDWPVARSSPELASVRAVGDKLLLGFRTQGEALSVQGGGQQPRGFEIAGADGRFRPAKSRLLFGVEIMLWHPDIPQPVSCQYGCRELNFDATLVTADGLAVVPFSTQYPRIDAQPDLRWMTMDNLEQWAFERPERPRPLPDRAGLVPLFTNLTEAKVRYELDTGQRHEGEASLRIQYRADRTVFPILRYEERHLSQRPLIPWQDYRCLRLAVFNHDRQPKRLRLAGQRDWIDCEQSLSWQIIELPIAGASFQRGLILELEDRQRQGTLLLDNLELVPGPR
ncbi:MAG: sialate O-acetylesterase [Bacillota bacterium]|nr:sialate O-acetylesterase [Bacillota bacterium]